MPGECADGGQHQGHARAILALLSVWRCRLVAEIAPGDLSTRQNVQRRGRGAKLSQDGVRGKESRPSQHNIQR